MTLRLTAARVARTILLQTALSQLWPDADCLPPHLPSAGDVPQSLPSFLVAHCGDPTFWIYSDQKCDGLNNCGDCSDELSPGGGLGAGWAGAAGWAVVRG